MTQKILETDGRYDVLEDWLQGAGKVFLVCDRFIEGQEICSYLEKTLAIRGQELVRFTDFVPNPKYDSVVEGVKRFRETECESVIAIGGGSAMDVAKCIKLYARLSGDGAGGGFLHAEIVPNDIPFLAVPTTAGTGSEATRYAVIYYEGAKQSVTHASMIPGTVVMDVSLLRGLPLYQRKATMMDAFCHALESFWSVNSTEESKAYSRKAIEGVLRFMEGYLANTDEGNAGMLRAAHTAGQAINITQTTAGHAMCYKITSLYDCAHGHAAALCARILFPHMIQNTDNCIDPRGEEYLKQTLQEIAEAMGVRTPEEAAEKFENLFEALELPVPEASGEDFRVLRTSVNPVRLRNHPVLLQEETIDTLYHEILREAR